MNGVDVIALLTGALAFVGSIFIANKKRNLEVSQKVLESVYAPLMVILEPYLFAKQSTYNTEPFKNACQEIHNLIEQEPIYFPFYLKDYFYEFERESGSKRKEKKYMTFSERFIDNYSFVCKSCGLPGIPESYRSHKGFYRNNFFEFCNWFKIYALTIYMIASFALVAVMIGILTYHISLFLMTYKP